MRVLSLDTTTRTMSAALIEDDRVVATYVGDSTGSHAERLPGALEEVVRAAGVSFPAVDVFAVAAGPGSFTGLRIGIATMQGLALVFARPIVPVSALEALAHAAADGAPDGPAAPGTAVAAWIDAFRRDVFSGVYRVAAAPPFTASRLVEIEGPTVDAPAATVARWSARAIVPAVCVGSGAVAYASLIAAQGTVLAPPPLAPVIGRVAVARATAGGGIDPAAVQPLYVRRPDAEIARERWHQPG
jgi:tRNA threonylcarbamoyladenosine biosynthesis protein TsaB